MRGRVAKKILKLGWRIRNGRMLRNYSDKQYDRAFRHLRRRLWIAEGAW